MSWPQVVPGVVALVAVLGLGIVNARQSGRIAELESQVEALADSGSGRERSRSKRGGAGERPSANGSERAAGSGGGGMGRPLVRPALDAGRDSFDDFSAQLDDMDPEVEAAVREIVRKEREAEREEERERRLERVTERIDEQVGDLELSTEQHAEVVSMWTTEFETMMSIRDEVRSGDLEWSEARARLEKLRGEHDARAEELLDATQYAEYTTAREQMGPGRGRRGGRGFGGPPPGPPPE